MKLNKKQTNYNINKQQAKMKEDKLHQKSRKKRRQRDDKLIIQIIIIRDLVPHNGSPWYSGVFIIPFASLLPYLR